MSLYIHSMIGIISGQTTLAYEILGQVKVFDTIIVQIGGEGLISGIASVIKT